MSPLHKSALVARRALHAVVALLAGCSSGSVDSHTVRESLLRISTEPTIQVRFPRTDAGDRRPVIVLVHGGAWVRGSRDDVAVLADAWLARGWVVVLPHYRLGPTAAPSETAADVDCALRWVRWRATLHRLDTGRVVVAGVSAGAHLAMLAATRSVASSPHCDARAVEPVSAAALIDWFGVVDLDSLDTERVGRRLLLDWLGADSSAATHHLRRSLSALPGLRRFPPALTVIVHARGDSVVSYQQAIMGARAVRDGGGTVEVITLPDRSHGLSPGRWAAVDDSVFRLVRRAMAR